MAPSSEVTHLYMILKYALKPIAMSKPLSYNGTVQQHRIKETNASENPRKIFVKIRKLGGKRGLLVRAVRKYMTSEDDEEEKRIMKHISSHWGLQVGSYMWELHTDHKMAKSLSVQRLKGDQIWYPDVYEVALGWTTFTDVEIDRAGKFLWIIS